MKKTLLSLVCAVIGLSLSAADITESWDSVDFGPSGQSPNPSTAESTKTGISYTFTNTKTQGLTYLSMKSATSAAVQFELPINCSQIKLTTSSRIGANCKITISADGEKIPDATSMAVGTASKEYTIDIPADYQKAGTVYKIARAAGAPQFSSFTYVEAAGEAAAILNVSTSELSFATVLNGTQTQSLTGSLENSTDDIALAVDNESFTVPATISATELAAGFDVVYTGKEAGKHTATLTLKAGDLTKTVALKTTTAAHAGTAEDPLTPTDVFNLNNRCPGSYYVTGTIMDKSVGSGAGSAFLEEADPNKNSIILKDAEGYKIGVNIEGSKDQGKLNIVENPDNIGKTIVIKGDLERWLNTDAVTNVEYISGLPDTPSGIAGIEADENAPVEYFNLQGIRVENPTNGLYIRRQGNKVTKVVIK